MRLRKWQPMQQQPKPTDCCCLQAEAQQRQQAEMEGPLLQWVAHHHQLPVGSAQEQDSFQQFLLEVDGALWLLSMMLQAGLVEYLRPRHVRLSHSWEL